MADSNPPQDSDAQEAYQAFKAWKAYKQQKTQQGAQPPANVANAQDQKAGGQEQAREMGLSEAWSNAKANLSKPIGEQASGLWKELWNTHGATGDDLGPAALAIPAEAAPAALQKIASYLGGSGFGPAMARIGTNTAIGAGQGYANDGIEGAKRGALVSGAMSTAGEGLSAAGNSIADRLQKWAVGIRKAPEGVGNSLVSQNVWGSKGHMLDQVGDKLVTEEGNLQDLVGQLKGNVDAQDIADAISQHGKKFVSPSGVTLNSVQGDLDKVRGAAEQFQSMGEGGELTPQDLLSLKRQGDWAGYTASGSPASATDAEIGRAVADKSRSLLSNMSGGETADTLKKEQALIYAKKALERDPTTHMGVGSSLFFGKMPGSSVLGSTAAQAAQRGVGGLGDALANPMIQSLFNQGQNK